MSISTVIVLALVILTIFILVPFTTLWAKTLTGQHKNELSTWVQMTASKLAISGGHGQETGNPPVSTLYEKPIEIYEEKDFKNNANKLITDAMLNCWESFGYGEIHFLGKNYDDSNKVFCFPCAQIKFSPLIKQNYQSLESIKFTEFLKTPTIKDGPTYIELFKGRLFYEPFIKQDEDLYIVFAASKGSIGKRISEAYSTPDFTIQTLEYAGVGTGLGSIGGPVGMALGAGLGTIFSFIKPIVTPGTTGSFEATLILATPKTITKFCNKQ